MIRDWLIATVVVPAVVALAVVPILAQGGAQAPADVTSRSRPASKSAASFNPRDLNGVWFRVSHIRTFGYVNPGEGSVRGIVGRPFEEAPFTPAGRAAFDKNKPAYGPRATSPAHGNDPMGTCDPLGVPRILTAEVEGSYETWEIVQNGNRMVQFFPWHHDWREVWTDGRSLPKADDLEPKWNGYSVGHWDGTTFVVDSIGFDDRTWLDKFGYPHTDQMKLQERYRRLDHDTLELSMTLTDPEYYTKPWVGDTKTFKLNASPFKDAKNWDEQIYCVPSEEFNYNRRVRDVAGGKNE